MNLIDFKDTMEHLFPRNGNRPSALRRTANVERHKGLILAAYNADDLTAFRHQMAWFAAKTPRDVLAADYNAFLHHFRKD